jgi:hypothetical protein
VRGTPNSFCMVGMYHHWHGLEPANLDPSSRRRRPAAPNAFLTEMADDYVPPGWYGEMERRRADGKDVAGREVLARSRELAARGR